MASLTLEQMLTLQTRDLVRARIIARATDEGLAVDSWTPASSGGFENTIVDMMAGVCALRIAPKLLRFVGMKLLPFATGADLTYVAKRFYKLDRRVATSTVQNMLLRLASTSTHKSFAAGDLVVIGAGGNRYVSTEPADIEPGGTANALFEAEAAGSSYSDASETITTLVTAFAGLSAVNFRAEEFLPAVVTGTSAGLVSAAFVDGITFLPPPSLRIRILETGPIGTARFLYSIDGGLTWVRGGPVPSSFSTNGIEVSFVDATSGGVPLTESFVAGDLFTLLRGEAIVQQGADEESDDELRERCRQMWSSLSAVPTEDLVALWARAASPEIERAIADGDPNTPGGILLTLASSAGIASPAAITAVQEFVTARLAYKGLTGPGAGPNSAEERVLARSATARLITPAAVAGAPKKTMQAVQAAAEQNWTGYLRSVPIGGVVRLSELIASVMDAGATFTNSEYLDGAAANVQLGALEVAMPQGTLLSALTWRSV